MEGIIVYQVQGAALGIRDGIGNSKARFKEQLGD